MRSYREYYPTTRRAGRPRTTAAMIAHAQERYVFPVFGDLALDRIEGRHLQALEERLDEAHLSESGKRMIFRETRAVFAEAVDDGLLASSPCAGFPAGGKPGFPATEEDRKKLEEAIAKLPLGRLIVFWQETGISFPAASALKVGDVQEGRVPLPSALDGYLEERLARGAGPDDLLFPDDTGRRVRQPSLHRNLELLRVMVGERNLRWPDLRRREERT